MAVPFSGFHGDNLRLYFVFISVCSSKRGGVSNARSALAARWSQPCGRCQKGDGRPMEGLDHAAELQAFGDRIRVLKLTGSELIEARELRRSLMGTASAKMSAEWNGLSSSPRVQVCFQSRFTGTHLDADRC